MRRRVRQLAAATTAMVLLAGLAGCRLHTDFTVREAPDSAVTFRLLSGDGRFVVVTATAAGATVPGAGTWRVERATGAAVALPAAASRISADGRRVLLQDGRLWRDDGPMAAAGDTWSDDLTYRTYLAGGRVTVQDATGGPPVDVEAAHPRPGDTTAATPVAVSDDGLTVHYRLTRAAGSVDRFVRLGLSPPLDLPAASSAGSTQHRYALAAGGAALLRTTLRLEPYEDPIFGPGEILIDTTYDLVTVPDGAVTATWTVVSADTTPQQRWTTRALVSEDGRRMWVLATLVRTARDLCGTGPSPVPLTCYLANTLTAVAAAGARSTSLGAGSVVGFDLTPDGMLAATDRRFPVPIGGGKYAPQITHAVEGAWETLGQGPTTTTSDAFTCSQMGAGPAPCTINQVGSDIQISDDGHVLAARSMTSTGWYDYVDTNPPG